MQDEPAVKDGTQARPRTPSLYKNGSLIFSMQMRLSYTGSKALASSMSLPARERAGPAAFGDTPVILTLRLRIATPASILAAQREGHQNDLLGSAHLAEFTSLTACLLEDNRLVGCEDMVSDRRAR